MAEGFKSLSELAPELFERSSVEDCLKKIEHLKETARTERDDRCAACKDTLWVDTGNGCVMRCPRCREQVKARFAARQKQQRQLLELERGDNEQ